MIDDINNNNKTNAYIEIMIKQGGDLCMIPSIKFFLKCNSYKF